MRLRRAPHRHTRPRSAAGWESAWRHPRRRRQTPSSRSAEEIPFPRAGSSPNQRSQTPCRDRPRTGAGSNLAIFLFFEKPLQVDTADGSGGSIKASAHVDLLAHQVNQFRRNVESFRLAVNQHGDLILRMQAFAVGTMTVGPAAGASAFDKRAGQHFAESTEAADEFAAQFQVGFAW